MYFSRENIVGDKEVSFKTMAFWKWVHNIPHKLFFFFPLKIHFLSFKWAGRKEVYKLD